MNLEIENVGSSCATNVVIRSHHVLELIVTWEIFT